VAFAQMEKLGLSTVMIWVDMMLSKKWTIVDILLNKKIAIASYLILFGYANRSLKLKALSEGWWCVLDSARTLFEQENS
jgi:hypothetical protein